MDVSPKLWRSHKFNDEKIKRYVIEKFTHDFYPRIVPLNGKKVDMDNSNDPLRDDIISKINRGDFVVEFNPEEERRKIGYVIKNGRISIHTKKKKENAKLCITVKEYCCKEKLH